MLGDGTSEIRETERRKREWTAPATRREEDEKKKADGEREKDCRFTGVGLLGGSNVTRTIPWTGMKRLSGG